MKKILYLGLDVPAHLQTELVIHCPLIQIVPRPKTNHEIARAFANFKKYSHVIFTSKSSVSILMDYAQHFKETIDKKCLIAVGKQTAAKLATYGLKDIVVSPEETAEGVVKALKSLELCQAFIFWPHSSLSRPLISDWLSSQNIPFHACPLYDTLPRIPMPIPNLDLVEEIVFTSPSTVDAFLSVYGEFPQNITLTCIGPITQQHLKKKMKAKEAEVVG